MFYTRPPGKSYPVSAELYWRKISNNYGNAHAKYDVIHEALAADSELA